MALLTKPIIFVATVSTIKQGIMTMSMPPQINGMVQVSGLKCLRGKVEGTRFDFIFEGKVPFETGKSYIFGADMIDEQLVVTECAPASEEGAIKDQLAKNPMGWCDGKSPYKKPFKHPELSSDIVCAATGRPFLKNGPNIVYKADKVIPADAQEYKNPYGDGKFVITVSNSGSAPEATAVLQGTASKTVYGEASVIAGTNGKYYVWDEEIGEALQQLVLQPGASAQFELDTLKLARSGLKFPNGGNRVYYDFVVGDKTVSDFFYYYSACHDKMVEALK